VTILTRNELGALIEAPNQIGVSIYMPTHSKWEYEQDPVRLRNLLRGAEKQLLESGLRTKDAKSLLDPAKMMLTDSLFWQHQSDSLAIFASSAIFRSYRLPYSFQELLVVAERFHIKPLLPLLGSEGLYYVLALSQNEVRLLQCTSDSTLLITPDNIPTSMSEALKYDDSEKQIQFHTGTSRGPGKRGAMFHGHGAGTDDKKANIQRYFRMIDRGLHSIIGDEKAPLIIASVDYLRSIYGQVNTYPHLMNKGLQGNPEGVSEEILRQKTWTIAKPYFEQDQIEARNHYNDAKAAGLATTNLEEAVVAAYDGRVSVLFAAVGVQQWGTFDLKHRRVELYKQARAGVEDLLDLTAVYTLAKGGTVYPVEPQKVPDNGLLAAIFRY
jgi:hypothetical protein